MDTNTIMQMFTAFIGFLLMALGMFLILAAFHKSGCCWLIFGVLSIIAGMFFCVYNFLAVIAGGIFGALLFAVVYFIKENNE